MVEVQQHISTKGLEVRRYPDGECVVMWYAFSTQRQREIKKKTIIKEMEYKMYKNSR
jgi:hypothetical protein